MKSQEKSTQGGVNDKLSFLNKGLRLPLEGTY